MMSSRPAARSTWSLGLASLVLVAAFAIRLPALAEPIGIDQGIFATAAWGMDEGLRLYTDLWDQKPPGIHLIYRVGFAILGRTPSTIFWIDFVSALACALLLWAWGTAASDTRLGLTAAAIFAVGSLPALRFSYGGFLERAVPETFIAVLLTAAATALTYAMRSHGWRWVSIAALAIATAGVIKPTAFVFVITFAIWVFGFVQRRPRLLEGLMAVVALVTPAVLVTLWLYAHGSLRDAWIAVVEYNQAYVSAGGSIPQLILQLAKTTWRYVKTDPVWTAGFCAIVLAMVASIRSRSVLPVPSLCFCWLIGSAVAIAANGIRMYTTYFIPPVPALAMATAWLLHGFPGRRRCWLGSIVVALAIVVSIGRGGASRFIDTTIADWRRFTGGDSGETVYLERFGGYQTGRGYSARANAELADYVKNHTEPKDRIYIFGMAPVVYFLSGRLPANRFLWAYPAVSGTVRSDAFTLQALTRSLEASAPRMLILERNNRDSLMQWRIEQHFEEPAMLQLLQRYSRRAQIEDFIIYIR